MRDNRWLILLVLCGGLFITGLDNTIVNVALPSIQSDLGATTAELQWVVDAYSVLFAGLLLLAGGLGDRFGRRMAFVFGLSVFAAGSVCAGLAATGVQLSLARAVMGVGGAFVMPSTLSIIVASFPDRTERSRAIGIWAGVSGIGIAAGPLVGGVLLAHFSWHSVFWVNPPIAIVLVALALWWVPESKDPSRPRVDIMGAGLWAVGLIALVVTIIEVPDAGVGATTLVSAVVAVAALVGFVLWERHTPTPIVPLSIFANRTFSTCVTLVALLYFALFGAMFFFPQFLQLVQGRSPLESGIVLLPGALALAGLSVVSPRIAERTGPRPVVITGLLLVVAGLASASWFSAGTPVVLVGGCLALIGAGMGLSLPHVTSGVLSAVPPQRAGMGSAMNETVGEVGGALGVAILGALLAASYRAAIDSAIAAAGSLVAPVPQAALEAVRDSLAGASLVIAQLPPNLAGPARRVAAEAFVGGMGMALWVGALVVAAGLLVAILGFPRELDPVEEG